MLIWNDERGKQRQQALGHADAKKAERQRAQKERELRMGIVEPDSMKLSEFLEDSLMRTRGQVRESTLYQAKLAMEHFIEIVGNFDYHKVKHHHGECFVQVCLDRGNSPATVAKKLRHLKRIFQLAVDRGQLEGNSFRGIKQPRTPRRRIRVLRHDECALILKSARKYEAHSSVKWELLIKLALYTGRKLSSQMRQFHF